MPPPLTSPPAPRKRASRPPRGFTLLELMIAVTILALGTLALLRVVDATQRIIAGQEARILAHHAALNRAAELRLAETAQARAALPETVVNGRHEWRVSRSERATRAGLVEVTLRLSAPGRPGANLVIFLSGQAEP
ncbi:MAG: prepilin-type N-terminal cleavage/methylation domain-containing protein [Pararhodobacter sp.]|nr:prepilin-type N-terminal cleavage/methylation domain-containing protein [Pararhodobacter sp.]